MLHKWHNVPDSTNVQSIGFDATTNEIIVLFKSGHCYAYNPGQGIFDSLVASESKGKFIHEVIKAGKFPFRRIDVE